MKFYITKVLFIVLSVFLSQSFAQDSHTELVELGKIFNIPQSTWLNNMARDACVINENGQLMVIGVENATAEVVYINSKASGRGTSCSNKVHGFISVKELATYNIKFEKTVSV